MKRKNLSFILTLALCVSLLAGCGGGGGGNGGRPAQASASASATTQPTSAPPAETNIPVTVTNSSSYVFNELYISPTAANDWGDDHLGSTMILKKNGSFDVSLKKYEFENYDIRVVDEDEDVYLFKYVPLTAKTTVVISWGDDGLVAEVAKADGSTASIAGEFVSSSGDAGSDSGNGGGSGVQAADYTTQPFSFTIYNESDFDIYAIYMEPAYESGDATDILPSILKAHESFEFNGQISNGVYGVTEWRLNVVDVDDDVSASYDVFDPWLVNYVDVRWDSDSFGYVCDFYY